MLHVRSSGDDGGQELGSGERMTGWDRTRRTSAGMMVRVVMDRRQVRRVVGHDERVAHVTGHH